MKNIYWQIRNGVPLSGGLRKRCFKINSRLVFCLWPMESLPKKLIERSISLELSAKRLGFPCRLWQKTGKSWLKKICFEKNDYLLGAGNYLPGKPCREWPIDYFFSAGEMLARLHRAFLRPDGQTLLHLDFSRGNILFDEEGKITGILDFEEADFGEPEKDLACSLSFFSVDASKITVDDIFKSFLGGYASGKGKFIYDKIRKHYFSFLKRRMEEGNKQAFLFLAHERLKNYREEVAKRVLDKSGLRAFSLKNRHKKIVLTVGAFELLHWGHLEFLKKARRLGGSLVVGVASDESRRRLKGDPYPLISARTRAETLAHFPFIDAVTAVDEDNVSEELKLLKPAVFYTVSRDWQEKIRKPEEKTLLESWGGKVVTGGHLSPKMSSSKMVEKVAILKIKHVLFGKTKRQLLLGLNRRGRIPKEIGFHELADLAKSLHKTGKTIAFTSLTADLFHLGHARFIQKAKSLADVLVVGVPGNASVTTLKGPGRPIVDEKARAAVLAELPWVDRVVIFDERTIFGCLRKLQPDVFFTVKEDWNEGFAASPEAKFMKKIGGKIVRSERQAPYLSASKIIDKAAGEMVQKKFFEVLKTAKETPVLDADGFDPYNPQVQLAAREKGFYEKVLAEVAKRGKCVFCDLKEKYLLAEKDGLVLTVALFPYIDGHLLIIPQRHIERLEELNEEEKETVFALCLRGKKVLKEKLGIENVWLLLREGKGIEAGKTVDHLHFHLIPYDPIVIRMADKGLSLKMTPLSMARKLRENK